MPHTRKCSPAVRSSSSTLPALSLTSLAAARLEPYNPDRLQHGKTDFGTHGLFIAGGSQPGLGSGDAITQAMIDDGIPNPSISGAVVYDLGVRVQRYDPAYGREAYQNATSRPVKNGNVGAGTGTSVGKFHYLEGTKIGAMSAGVGNAHVKAGNAVVCALSVVNALGNIVLPDGSILAGNRDGKGGFRTFATLTDFVTREASHTTISIVGTNIDLGPRESYTPLVQQATNGQIRALDPVNTSLDGDTVFVFSTQETDELLNPDGESFKTADWPEFSADIVAQMVARAVRESIYNAGRSAATIQFEAAYEGSIPGCLTEKEAPATGTP